MKYSFKDKTYFTTGKVNPKDLITVEIGDSKEPDIVLPQQKITRWDNESNVSVRLLDFVEYSVFQDQDKVVFGNDKQEVHIYPITSEEGGQEFEVILHEKPLTNVLRFSLVDKDVEYFYQPPLTQEELDEGAVRPENVVGSYAVYAKSSKTNYVGGKEYKCGKVGHIFRPRIEDSVGNWVWGELNIDQGILSVTIPQEFLETAVYPVRHAAGLTFGYTTVGASQTADNQSLRETNVIGEPLLSVTSMSTYTKTSSGTVDHATAIYSDTTGSLLANSSDTVSVNTSADWYTNTLTYTTATDFDMNFFLATWANGNRIVYYDTGGDSYIPSTPTPTWPTWETSFTAGTIGSLKYSIYATYSNTDILVASNNIGGGTNYSTGTSTTIKRAQQFSPSSNGNLSVVKVKIAKTNSPTDTIQCDIYSDNSNLPNISLASADSTIDASSLTTTSTYYSFTFTNGPSITSGTNYWIVLTRTGSVDATNYYTWRGSSSLTYNLVKIFNGTDWNGTTSALGQAVYVYVAAAGGGSSPAIFVSQTSNKFWGT